MSVINPTFPQQIIKIPVTSVRDQLQVMTRPDPQTAEDRMAARAMATPSALIPRYPKAPTMSMEERKAQMLSHGTVRQLLNMRTPFGKGASGLGQIFDGRA